MADFTKLYTFYGKVATEGAEYDLHVWGKLFNDANKELRFVHSSGYIHFAKSKERNRNGITYILAIRIEVVE